VGVGPSCSLAIRGCIAGNTGMAATSTKSACTSPLATIFYLTLQFGAKQARERKVR
jgi:hypothetical protein